jgi:N-acetyl sugar amidotransferase
LVSSKGQICTRCILDTTVPEISFDSKGVCSFCKIHDSLEKTHPLHEEGKKYFTSLIEQIKKEGGNNAYDCIVGVSGGRDSTYTLYTAVEMGLRPLAVHFDNGWNSEIAVNNIKNATNKLDIDLHTVVADWEEFKDLQKSFLSASVSDAEVPTDYVIISVLMQTANKFHVRYIFNGHSFRTEGVAPIGWTYMDGKYIRSVHARFGKQKITSFPVMSLSELLYYTFIKRIRMIDVPEFIEYNQAVVDDVLKNKLGWNYYGGHHHENVFTEFFQSFYLPKKFDIDKRKLEYSALVRSGQMKREDALNEVQHPYSYNPEIIDYTLSKMGLSKEKFQEIMDAPRKSFKDYPTYYPIIKAARFPIGLACSLHLLPPVFYEKYLGG